MSEAVTPTKYLRLHQILGTRENPGLVPVSSTTWYSWIQQGRAPQPVKLGPRTSAWRESDIADFLEARTHEPTDD